MKNILMKKTTKNMQDKKDKNECQMTSLKDFLNESLIQESNDKVVAFFDHESPETTWLVIGIDTKTINKIPNGFDVIEIPNKGNLLDITHSDEWGSVTDLGCKNESQLKSKVIKSIEKHIKNVEPDYAYIKFNPIPFDNEYEDYDNKEDYTKLSANDWYQKLIEMYDNSFIDGDSSSARIVYDPNKREVIFGGGMDIICQTANEFEETLREWEED